MVPSLPNDLKSQLGEKRLFFTITTGRSGTGYLSKVLNFVPTAASYHEAQPTFSEVMRLVQQDKNAAYHFWIKSKLPVIANNKYPIYIETSHLFCKGFIEPLLDLNLTPGIIILTRSHRDVATSLFRLQTIPGRSEKGLMYYLSPDDPGVLPLPGWQKLHDYQLCYWYCLEIERRCKNYEQIFTALNAHVAKVTLDELNTVRGVYYLLKQLGLPQLGILFWFYYFINKKKKINTKNSKKISLSLLPAELDKLEKEVMQLVKGI